MSRPPATRRTPTLGEHFFWTVVVGVTLCLALAVALFVSA